ncbi:MAG: hypothetical protein AAGA47_04360 [Pseudomonadota bacterium]
MRHDYLNDCSNQRLLVTLGAATYAFAMVRAFLLCLLLAGCADFPELGEVESPGVREAPYLDFLLADDVAALQDVDSIEIDDPLASRLARLRARAELLRGPIFTSSDRALLSGSPN